MTDWSKIEVQTKHWLREEYVVPARIWDILTGDRRGALAMDIVRERLMARIEHADVQVDPSEIQVRAEPLAIDGGAGDEMHVIAEVDVTHLRPTGGH